MKIRRAPNPIYNYPWFIMHGTEAEEKRLKKMFHPQNAGFVSPGIGHSSGRILLTAPDGASAIAVDALRVHSGVWFQKPKIVHPLPDLPGHYDGIFPISGRAPVEGANLDYCRGIVADILLKENFITEQQRREFDSNFGPTLHEIPEARGKVWMALRGPEEEIARLMKTFSPFNGNILAPESSLWRKTAGLIIQHAQEGFKFKNGETAIATQAASFKPGEVIIRRPYFIKPVKGYGYYFTHGLQLREVKPGQLEDICRQNVADILQRADFITADEAKRIAALTTLSAKPQTMIVLANPTPQPASQLGKLAQS